MSERRARKKKKSLPGPAAPPPAFTVANPEAPVTDATVRLLYDYLVSVVRKQREAAGSPPGP